MIKLVRKYVHEGRHRAEEGQLSYIERREHEAQRTHLIATGKRSDWKLVGS